MQEPDRLNQPTVVLLVDELPLRRAAVYSLLHIWAKSVGALHLEEASDSDSAESSMEDWAMVVVSLGGKAIADPEFEADLDRIRSIAARVPVVVLSDLHDTAAVATAFEAGVCGFVPMSTPLDIAFKALTFILGGGHFFPPSVLQPARSRSESEILAKDAIQQNDNGTKMKQLPSSRRLTVRITPQRCTILRSSRAA